MKKLLRFWVLCITAFFLPAANAYASPVKSVTSPDGNIVIQFEIKTSDSIKNGLYWTVLYKDRTVLKASRIGFALNNGPALEAGFKNTNSHVSSHDSTWKPVYGERSSIRNHYNQLQVRIWDDQPVPRQMMLTFRAYDEGAAFRVTFPRQEAFDQLEIKQEQTQFRFTSDHWAWAVYSAQGRYVKRRLSKIGSNCERPLTMKVRDNLYLSVLEAGLVDYARMKLQQHPSLPYTLTAQLGSPVAVKTPYEIPWRVVMIAETPGQLLEHNYLVLNLNKPCAIEDTSWIVPGKMMRDITLTVANSKDIVDFAGAAGIDYLHIDAGWYGHEYNDRSDATTITPDRGRSEDPDNYDLQEIINYAHDHGLKVMVYVNRRHLETQLDEILPLYRKWGVDGIKFGFVNVGTQCWTDWLHEAVRKAAAYQFVVDVHDEYRLTGYERTYPNLMTAEGIRGNEAKPTAELNLVHPFTRFLCGAADYTICWHYAADTDRLRCTWPHQMAASVVYYSPLQFLFWYDTPAYFTGDEPYLEYFKHLKTVWDQTEVVHGQIGEYITVARRSGSDWFVGTMNAVRRRQLEIPLDFLTPGKTYTAYVYKDTDPAKRHPIKQVRYETQAVTSESVIYADMASNGGQAMRIVAQ